MVSDLTFTVGGVEAVTQASDVAFYLGKVICVHVEIPKGAKVSLQESVSSETLDLFDPISKNEKTNQKETDSDANRLALGLEVKIIVINQNVTIENGACLILHLVWQSKC